MVRIPKVLQTLCLAWSGEESHAGVGLARILLLKCDYKQTFYYDNNRSFHKYFILFQVWNWSFLADIVHLSSTSLHVRFVYKFACKKKHYSNCKNSNVLTNVHCVSSNCAILKHLRNRCVKMTANRYLIYL